MPRIEFVAKPSDLLVITRSVDVYFVIIWAIYAGWGITAAIAGLPSISESQGKLYNTLWSGSIGLLGLAAMLGSLSLFIKTSVGQISKKRLEISIDACLALFVAVYPITLYVQAFVGGGGLPSAILTTAFVVIPIMRMHLLYRRIKQYVRH